MWAFRVRIHFPSKFTTEGREEMTFCDACFRPSCANCSEYKRRHPEKYLRDDTGVHETPKGEYEVENKC